MYSTAKNIAMYTKDKISPKVLRVASVQYELHFLTY